MSGSIEDLNRNLESGIDGKAISILCLDIQSVAEITKKTLDNINDLIDASKSYYDGDTRSSLLEKKANLMLSRNNIVNNELSYIDDYNVVVSRFRTNDVSLTLSQKIDS